MNETVRKSKGSDVFQYALGGFGSNLAYLLVMSWLTYYYTDIYGLPALSISVLMLAARVIDAVTDPLMGMIGDRTRSKMGRFRPWIIAGAPVLGLLIFLLFAAPNLSPVMKIVYAYVVYIIYSLASTMVNIPYQSLAAVMTNDPKQRNVVVTLKQGMSIPASVFTGVLALPIVNAMGGGIVGWRVFGLLCGVLTTIAFWFCAHGAKPVDTLEMVPEKQESLPFREQLKLIFGNKPLLMLLIAFSTDQFAGAIASAVNVYYFTYYLGRQDLVSTVSLCSIAVNVCVMLCIPFLTNKIGKRTLYMASTCLVIIPYVVLFFTGTSIFAIIALILVATGLATITGTVGWNLLTDCIDYGEWKFGIRGEGTISSSLTFANKVGMALGGSLTTMILAASGYVANAAVQSDATLTAIKAMKFLCPVAGYVCSIIAMMFYCITPKFYTQMMKEISERKMKEQ